MNISSIGGATGPMGIGGAGQQDFRARMQQAMAPVADLFGMSSDQLMSAVKASDGTLAEYAASKGISSADLTAAIKQGLQDNAPNGVTLSETQLTNLAQRIENHRPGDGPKGPPPARAADATVAGGGTSDITAELEKLIADLKALQSASDNTTTTTSVGGATSSAAMSTSALLELLTRFDEQL